MKIVWTRDAADDLEDVLNYISERSPKGAQAVAEQIAVTLDSISRFPKSGRLDEVTGCRERLAGRFSLLLVYAIGDEHIEIIALFHTSRDPATKPKPGPA